MTVTALTDLRGRRICGLFDHASAYSKASLKRFVIGLVESGKGASHEKGSHQKEPNP